MFALSGQGLLETRNDPSLRLRERMHDAMPVCPPMAHGYGSIEHAVWRLPATACHPLDLARRIVRSAYGDAAASGRGIYPTSISARSGVLPFPSRGVQTMYRARAREAFDIELRLIQRFSDTYANHNRIPSTPAPGVVWVRSFVRSFALRVHERTLQFPPDRTLRAPVSEVHPDRTTA